MINDPMNNQTPAPGSAAWRAGIDARADTIIVRQLGKYHGPLSGMPKDERERYIAEQARLEARNLAFRASGTLARASIADWQFAIHRLATEKGWWDDKDDQETRAEKALAVLALVHGELSVILETLRSGLELAAGVGGLTIDQMCDDAMVVVARLGPTQINLLARLALVHSEVSEAVEAVVQDNQYDTRLKDNKGKPEGLAIEIADVVIRCLDIAEAFNMDMSGSMVTKHSYNATRVRKHGKVI